MLRIRNYFIMVAVVFAISSAYAVIGVQDAKAQSTMGDLIQRIEALESKGGGSVTAPKIKGIKIGGSIRHRFELQHEFGSVPTGSAGTGVTDSAADDYVEDFTVQRARLYFDLDVSKNVRGYIKFQDVRTWGFEENSAGSGTVGNLSRVDLLEGYAELKNLGDLTSALENINVRIGRWQWFYGDHRLIGHLNWANEGRSYDGVRVRWAKNKNWIDVFGSQIDEYDTGSDVAAGEADQTGTIRRGNRDHLLWGFYSHFKVADGVVLEPYMINRFESRDRDGNEGAAAGNGEHRYTFGARIAGKKIPSLPGVDFTLEQMVQTGDTEVSTELFERDINAFAGAWGAGYTFSDVAWSPRIGYQFAYAEGDSNPNDRDNDTFDHLFPTGHARLGYMDFHGFQNIQAHKIMLSAKPSKKLLLKADLWFFEADEEVDNWYGVVGGSFGAGNTARKTNPATGANITDDEYGQELDLVFKYKLFKGLGVAGGYSHYFVDDYIEDFRGGDESGADWVWLQTTLKF
jgi:hypothetical protein